MRPSKILVPCVLSLLLAAGCSDDDDPTGPPPAPPEPTHYEVEVSMYSISVTENCEDDPGNPGDFFYTVVVGLRNEADTGWLQAGGGELHEVKVDDHSTEIVPHDPVRFTVPNEPGAAFLVQYEVFEVDPDGTDFYNIDTYTHVLDVSEDQLWAAEDREFAYYSIDESGNGAGEFYCGDWYTVRCAGHAYYIVTWKPVYEDDQDNGQP